MRGFPLFSILFSPGIDLFSPGIYTVFFSSVGILNSPGVLLLILTLILIGVLNMVRALNDFYSLCTSHMFLSWDSPNEILLDPP